jgi:hypothetical protein
MSYRWWLHPRREHRSRQVAQDQVLDLDQIETNLRARVRELEAEVSQLQRPAFRIRIARNGQTELDVGYLHPRTCWMGAFGDDWFLRATWYPEDPTVIRCRGCGNSWPDQDGACTCICTDKTAPGYEDWVTELGG